jgi:FkbM family methyltransferase
MDTENIEALGRTWLWPTADRECRKVVFGWAADLDVVYRHCRSFRFAFQAGGNMGVWPWLLAKRFQQVLTLEPDPECFACLEANLQGARNIGILPWALWAHDTDVRMSPVAGNLGAQSVVLGGDLKATTIDALTPGKPVDLIYLDIEGAEWEALHGATETLARCKPTVVVEDKNLGSVPKGAIEKWLAADFGYRVVARPHRDVVMVCE